VLASRSSCNYQDSCGVTTVAKPSGESAQTSTHLCARMHPLPSGSTFLPSCPRTTRSHMKCIPSTWARQAISIHVLRMKSMLRFQQSRCKMPLLQKPTKVMGSFRCASACERLDVLNSIQHLFHNGRTHHQSLQRADARVARIQTTDQYSLMLASTHTRTHSQIYSGTRGVKGC
jgi:hypothetical protein